MLANEVNKFWYIKPNGIQVRSIRQHGFCFGFKAPDAVQKTIEEASPVLIGASDAVVEKKRSTNSKGGPGIFSGGKGVGFRNEDVRGRGGFGGGRNDHDGNSGGGRGLSVVTASFHSSRDDNYHHDHDMHKPNHKTLANELNQQTEPLFCLIPPRSTESLCGIQKEENNKVCHSGLVSSVVDGGLAKSKKRQKKENIQKLKASKVCYSGLVSNEVDGGLAKSKEKQKQKKKMYDGSLLLHDEEDELTFGNMAQLSLDFELKASFPKSRNDNSPSHHKTDLSNELNKTSPFSLILPRGTQSLRGINDEENLESRSCEILRPGLVLLKNYVCMSDQVEIVNTCQEFGMGPGGFYQPAHKNGGKLKLHMMCFGRNWDPITMYDSKCRIDGSEAPSIPDQLISLVLKLIQESQAYDDCIPSMDPDICIVNFYTTTGRLGLHQDRDESESSLKRGLPVVSVSIGDSAIFLYGNSRDVDKANEVLLESGDVLIFGGKSRHVYHGVTNIIPNSAPSSLLQQTKLRPGRLNLTFRQY